MKPDTLRDFVKADTTYTTLWKALNCDRQRLNFQSKNPDVQTFLTRISEIRTEEGDFH